jgi:SsrA-binding protein
VAKDKKDERKVLLRNRKARHDYEVDEVLETGVVLVGSEVKSLREGHGALVDAYGDVRGGELWLVGAKIDPYPWANQFNHEPLRARKLLAHKAEIRRLATKVRDKGYTLVPLEIYLREGKVKVELALARGRKHYEKREAKKEAEAKREMEAGDE